MILSINTTNRDKIGIALREGDRVVVRKEFEAKYSQAEKLLPAIDKMLASKKIKLSDLAAIKVASKGDASTSFTALRIGVVTANALGYALGIPVRGRSGAKDKRKKSLIFNVIEPIYPAPCSAESNTLSKKI